VAGTLRCLPLLVLEFTASRVQQSAKNWVVMVLTGRPAMKRSQTSSGESVGRRSRPWHVKALGSGSPIATDCSASRRGWSDQV